MLKFVKTQRLIAINSLWKRCSWFQNSLICDKVFSKNWNRENYSLSYTMIHTSSIRPCHKMETMFSQCLPNLKNFFVPNSHNYKHFKHLPFLILFSLFDIRFIPQKLVLYLKRNTCWLSIWPPLKKHTAEKQSSLRETGAEISHPENFT